MQKKIISLIVITLLTLLISSTFAQSNDSQITQISDDLLNCLKNNDFEAASNLFHYPSNYTPQELKKEHEVIIKTLKYFNTEFGNISNTRVDKTHKSFESVHIGSGDLPYWKKHPQAITLIYETVFSKEKEGYIAVCICKITDKYEIRSVGYGLSTNKENTKKRMADIINGFLQLMEVQ